MSAAISLYVLWPQLGQLSVAVGTSVGDLGSTALRMFETAYWLVVPLVTMILATRSPAPPPRQAARRTDSP